MTTPMTVRLSDEEHEVLRLMAAWWCSQGKIDRPDKAAAIRRMLRLVSPPNDPAPLAAEMRKAYEAMLKADEPQH